VNRAMLSPRAAGRGHCIGSVAGSLRHWARRGVRLGAATQLLTSLDVYWKVRISASTC